MMTTLALSVVDLHTADSAGTKLHRIVSINLCADELVLRLAEPRNIASVTWLSRGSSSNVPELAADIPINHGLAEEIIPLNPDLVMAGIYTTRAAVAMLKRTNFSVFELDVPRNLAEVRHQYLETADVLGERARGERIVADLEARLAALETERPSERTRAIVLNPNGMTVTRGTLVDEIMSRAGLENVAATLGLPEYQSIPLETVVSQGVEVLILSSYRDGPPALASEILNHPVLARIADRTRVVAMPSRLWQCAGPTVADAVELLMGVAKDVRAKASRR